MASIFTSRVTRDLTVPFGDGGTVKIRKLNQKQLQQALIANFKEQVRLQEEIFGAERVNEIRNAKPDPEAPPEPKPDPNAKPSDPLSDFDKVTLMAKAILSWSFTNEDGSPVERTDAALADMDDDAAGWIATEILKLAKPSLFESKAEQETERKND